MKHLVTAAALGLFCCAASAQPITTAFTYQGRVDNNGQPASGLHDLRFRLLTPAGAQVGPTLCADNVVIAGGNFTTSLDFGAVFDGQQYQLEISVRPDTGLACAVTTGYTTLAPRQPIVATPYSFLSLNASSLGGQASTFFTNAANLTTGTIPDARLATTVARTNTTQTFTGATSFTNAANAFTGSGAGLTSLNAASLSLGTVSDARLPGNIARLDLANTFSAANTFNANVGIGTAAPGERLEVFGADATLRVRNSNDTGGGFVLDTFSTLQLGLYNPTAAAWGNIPANTKRSLLGMQNTGRVGTLTNTSGSPIWRNVLDDGNGNASFAGAASATTASNSGGAVTGTTTSAVFGTEGVFGLAPTTGTSSAVGVRGEARGNSGYGMYGIATSTTGQSYGVVGTAASTNSFSSGVYGESNSANGVQGYSFDGKALFGRCDNSYGLYAQTTSGGVALFGIRTANNNRGWFGGAGEGGWAESPSGIGFVAKSTTGSYALYAERNPGGATPNVNRGWFGGGGEGAWAESDQGNGIVALSRGLNSAAVYCRNDAGGRALFADGVAAVRALDILGGADIAEPFDVAGVPDSDAPAPGMVVVIDPDHPGNLRIANSPYDTKVAGIISGANGLSPGMVLRDEHGRHTDGQHPVAMTGRVWCYTDATAAEVHPGDRLTTSTTPGHAMRADNTSLAPGAVIGKAMTPLAKGEKGLVLVLVNLQ